LLWGWNVLRVRFKWFFITYYSDRYNKTSIAKGKSTMPITLDLPPKIEALLRKRAESTGQDISQMALSVMALGLSLDDNDFFEALKGIQRGLDDFEQGQFSSLEDFIAEQNHSLWIVS
jgi:hypothetical protein